MTRAPGLFMVVHGNYPADPRVARETNAAVRAGFEVDVVAMREPGKPANEKIEGVAVHRLRISRKRGAGRVRFFGEYVAFTGLAALHVARLAVRRRPAIVQVHNPPDFLVAAALAPKALGARVVFDIHDLSSDMFAMRLGDSRSRRVAQKLLERLERLACRVADVVVTVHEPYREELARRGVDKDRILVVLNSLDEARLPDALPPPRRNPFRIAYHGTVTPHYGLAAVLEAFALLPGRLSAALQIVGTGDAVPELAARAAELGISDRVELAGAVPHPDVLRRIAGASVGVIPNLPSRLNRFALSTKLFEYVVLGIPVVVSDLPTLRRHFSAEEVVFFRAGDTEALADALTGVADDYDAALARAAAARDRYRKSYDWDGQSERYARMLEHLAAGRSWTASAPPAGGSDG
jgi:glycosyltransferase involved in cell wall biosynthesis